MDAPVYKKLLDIERQQENPFHTSEGLTVVSEAENFWVRLSREGTQVTGYKEVTATNTLTIESFMSPGASRRFYPKRLILTAMKDTKVLVGWSTKHGRTVAVGVNSMPTMAFQQVVIPAGNCVVVSYDGDFFLDGSSSPLELHCQSLVTGETGKLYVSIDGWEVTPNA